MRQASPECGKCPVRPSRSLTYTHGLRSSNPHNTTLEPADCAVLLAWQPATGSKKAYHKFSCRSSLGASGACGVSWWLDLRYGGCYTADLCSIQYLRADRQEQSPRCSCTGTFSCSDRVMHVG